MTCFTCHRDLTAAREVIVAYFTESDLLGVWLVPHELCSGCYESQAALEGEEVAA